MVFILKRMEKDYVFLVRIVTWHHLNLTELFLLVAKPKTTKFKHI